MSNERNFHTKKLYITTIEKTEFLVKFDYMSECFIAGTIIYPYSEIPFEYYNNEVNLSKNYNIDKLKEVIYEIFSMYEYLVKNQDTIIKNTSHFPSGHISVIAGIYHWGPRIRAFCSGYVSELEKKFKKEFFTNKVKERLYNNLWSLIRKREFIYKAINKNNYEKVFSDAIKDCEVVMDIDNNINYK